MKKYLLELKSRILLIIFFLFYNQMFFYFHKEFLLFLIVKITHLNCNKFLVLNSPYYFIFTNVTEMFTVYLNTITYFNLQLVTFFIFFQFICFMGPAFFKYEYKNLLLFFQLGVFFYIISLIISYFWVIPTTWEFFLGFQNYQKNLYFEVRLLEYLHFCKNINYYCFLYFQTLTFIIFVCYQKINILFIKKYRKIFYYVLVMLVLFLGSFDLVLNQIFGYFFLIFLLEIALFLNIINK